MLGAHSSKLEGPDLGTWLEFNKRPGERVSLEVERVLHLERTKFQQLQIADTVSYGRALFLDHKIQSAELDEFIYHEALVHPALVLHPNPRSVLVIGGGEGASLREVLRHRTVERAVMVDIDQQAVTACREHLGTWHQGAFDDSRAELVHVDARSYLELQDEHFDSIIVDVNEPLAGGASFRLFTRQFYELAERRLTEHGTLAAQAQGVDLGVLGAHLSIAATLRVVFPKTATYQAYVPSFGEAWGFVLAAKTREPGLLSPGEIDAILAERGRSGQDLRFYDGETHKALFALPRYLRLLLAEERQIVTDEQPVFVT
jgi:spermidine synthase